jgi:structure-specific recognition protein 1
MAWKSDEGAEAFTMPAADIKWAQWLRVARNFQLRVGLKDRSRETLDGFVREVRIKISPSFASQSGSYFILFFCKGS